MRRANKRGWTHVEASENGFSGRFWAFSIKPERMLGLRGVAGAAVGLKSCLLVPGGTRDVSHVMVKAGAEKVHLFVKAGCSSVI